MFKDTKEAQTKCTCAMGELGWRACELHKEAQTNHCPQCEEFGRKLKDALTENECLAASCKVVTDRLAAAEDALAYSVKVDGHDVAKDAATIEALNLRVARLVEAVRKNHEWHIEYDEYGGYQDSEMCEVNSAELSTTAQDDQAWLREKQVQAAEPHKAALSAIIFAACAYIEDGSSQAVQIRQDDATKGWILTAGKRCICEPSKSALITRLVDEYIAELRSQQSKGDE